MLESWLADMLAEVVHVGIAQVTATGGRVEHSEADNSCMAAGMPRWAPKAQDQAYRSRILRLRHEQHSEGAVAPY